MTVFFDSICLVDGSLIFLAAIRKSKLLENPLNFIFTFFFLKRCLWNSSSLQQNFTRLEQTAVLYNVVMAKGVAYCVYTGWHF